MGPCTDILLPFCRGQRRLSDRHPPFQSPFLAQDPSPGACQGRQRVSDKQKEQKTHIFIRAQ